MKKIYIQPTTEVVKLTGQNMMVATSFKEDLGDEDTSGEDALSKSSGDWNIWGNEE